MQLEIETPALQTLCNLAEQVGACTKNIRRWWWRLWYLLYTKRTTTTQIENQWAKAQIQVLPLTIAEAW